MSYENPQMTQTVAALRAGEPAVYPTETVYGIGVAVGKAASPDVLFDIKKRDHGKPVAWLVGDVDDLSRYGRAVPDFACALARTFWPGPLTLTRESERCRSSCIPFGGRHHRAAHAEQPYRARAHPPRWRAVGDHVREYFRTEAAEVL